MSPRTTVAERIEEHRSLLTRSQLQVADMVRDRPQDVAFCSLAEIGRMSGTSIGTVVRLASTLGFGGWTELKRAVQEDLSPQLGPAAEGLRDLNGDDLPARVLNAAMTNIKETLRVLDRTAFDAIAGLWSDPARHLLFCPGECARGVVEVAAANLADLRSGVTVLDGNLAQIGRGLAQAGEGDVLVVVDFHRYDRWVLKAARLARGRKIAVVAITDKWSGELAGLADRTLTVSADRPGPFDSHAGTLALLDALVTSVAQTDRPEAARRLDEVEKAWRALGTFAADE